MEAIFPLWGWNTSELAEEIIASGFKAVVVAVNSGALGKECLGLEFNKIFLENLPAGVDPCGEKGEFPTFVHDGPK